jgi:hypothetical protein
MKSEDYEELSSVDTFARLTGLLYETNTQTTTTLNPSTMKLSKTMKTNSRNKLKSLTTESNRFRMLSGTTTLSTIRSTTESIHPFSHLTDLSLDDSQEFDQGSTLLLSLLAALLFCACFMASTIAIVSSSQSSIFFFFFFF